MNPLSSSDLNARVRKRAGIGAFGFGIFPYETFQDCFDSRNRRIGDALEIEICGLIPRPLGVLRLFGVHAHLLANDLNAVFLVFLEVGNGFDVAPRISIA